MNGAMNVTSGLLFGDIYSFDDEEFKKVVGLIKTTFNEFKSNQIARAVIYLLPEFVIRSKICRKVYHYFLPTLDKMGVNVYEGFYQRVKTFRNSISNSLFDSLISVSTRVKPFLLKKIQEHQKTIDKENPRDLIDFMLLETEQNPRIGWHSIIFTCMALYIGGSDTIASTMRWVLVCLAQNIEDQQKCRYEIQE